MTQPVVRVSAHAAPGATAIRSSNAGKPIIEVRGVSKRYQLGAIGPTRLIDDVERWWRRARGKQSGERATDFWALRDVSFEVERGSVVGLVGRNGAGKSTLLKILSRITAPTSGEILLRGRVASLLEVGTGFVPDLTGRDNVFLNGAILGMTKAEIRRRFDEIVAFAEVDRFIDTPVKRYSSGMYVRLAFAIAAHLEPDILIIDEVLAVGDAQFQKKCLGKMGDVAEQGRTIFFVSHNLTAVRSLCRSAILLEGGKLVANDSVDRIASIYLRRSHEKPGESEWINADCAPGNDWIRIKSIRARPDAASQDGLLTMQQPVRVETEFWVLQGGATYHLTYHLINEEGITVLTTGSRAQRRDPGLYRTGFTIPGNLLNSGGYWLTLLLVRDENQVAYQREQIASFSVVDASVRDHAVLGREPGVIQVQLPWSDEIRMG